jgi:hypothetical protein
MLVASENSVQLTRGRRRIRTSSPHDCNRPQLLGRPAAAQLCSISARLGCRAARGGSNWVFGIRTWRFHRTLRLSLRAGAKSLPIEPHCSPLRLGSQTAPASEHYRFGPFASSTMRREGYAGKNVSSRVFEQRRYGIFCRLVVPNVEREMAMDQLTITSIAFRAEGP